jgi:hypothetical protein
VIRPLDETAKRYLIHFTSVTPGLHAQKKAGRRSCPQKTAEKPMLVIPNKAKNLTFASGWREKSGAG